MIAKRIMPLPASGLGSDPRPCGPYWPMFLGDLGAEVGNRAPGVVTIPAAGARPSQASKALTLSAPNAIRKATIDLKSAKASTSCESWQHAEF